MATGTGEVAIKIKRSLPKANVFGIDLSNNMLSIAKEKSKKINFSIQNIEKTKFKSNYFDAVTISFALHELPKKNRLNVMKEAYRILKKKGRFIIIDMGIPKSKILRALLWIHIKLFEENYANTILKENFRKELKKNKFHNIKSKKHFNGLVKFVRGIK